MEPKLSDVLAAGLLVPSMRCRSLDDALRRLLAPPLSGAGWSDDRVDEVLAAVLRREKSCSTAIGPVALPHARVPGLDRIVASLGANPDGVYEDGDGTSFVLAFASPAQSAVDHLKFLARAAHLFRDEDARTHLLAATDPAEMLAVIRRAER